MASLISIERWVSFCKEIKNKNIWMAKISIFDLFLEKNEGKKEEKKIFFSSHMILTNCCPRSYISRITHRI